MPDLHLSHRSRLIAKDPRFYTELFPDTDPDLEYVWPEPKHELLPEDPAGDRMWVLRLPLGDTEPGAAEDRQPAARWPRARPPPQADDYQFVYADSGSRRPAKVRKLPAEAARQEAHPQAPAAGRGVHHPSRQLGGRHPVRRRQRLRGRQGPGPSDHRGRPLRPQLPGGRDRGPLGLRLPGTAAGPAGFLPDSGAVGVVTRRLAGPSGQLWQTGPYDCSYGRLRRSWYRGRAAFRCGRPPRGGLAPVAGEASGRHRRCRG